MWARGVGGFGNVASDGNGPALTFSGGGVVVGADTQVDDQWLVGASLGYVSGSSASSFVGSTVTASNYQAALYSNWQSGPFFVDGQLAYTHADYTTERTLSFGGFSSQAQGKPGGNALTMASRAGLTLRAGPVLLEPSLGLDWYHVSRNAFSESGADVAGLAVAAQSVDVVKPSIGLRLTSSFTIDQDLIAMPEARVRYYHDVGDGRVPVTAALLGLPGTSFTTLATYPGRDSVVLGVRLSAQRSRAMRLFVDYNVELANHLTAHTMTGGVRLSF